VEKAVEYYLKYLDATQQGDVILGRDRAKNTPLMLALQYGNAKIARMIYEASKNQNGFKISTINSWKQNILHFAAMNSIYNDEEQTKFAQLVGQILRAHSKELRGRHINQPDRYQMTPFLYACEYSFPALVDILLRNGADVTKKDADNKDWHFHIKANDMAQNLIRVRILQNK
jgi:ankyrin repeat protein